MDRHAKIDPTSHSYSKKKSRAWRSRNQVATRYTVFDQPCCTEASHIGRATGPTHSQGLGSEANSRGSQSSTEHGTRACAPAQGARTASRVCPGGLLMHLATRAVTLRSFNAAAVRRRS